MNSHTYWDVLCFPKIVYDFEKKLVWYHRENDKLLLNPYINTSKK